MKKRKRKIIYFLIIILSFCIFLLQDKKIINKDFQDDIIFFKLFRFGNNEEIEKQQINHLSKISFNDTQIKQEEMPIQYSFNVSYKDIDFKNINLSNTINKNSLINEKIAPRNFRKV